jgi:hypothetical protein
MIRFVTQAGLGDPQVHPLSLRLGGKFEMSRKIGQLFNLGGKHRSFRDVLQALGSRDVTPAEEAAAVVGGDVFAGDLPFSDETAGEAGGTAVF